MNSSWIVSNPERWCCESAALNMPANLENSAVATGLEKVSFIPIPKKGSAKECSNYCTIALISHTSKVMLKFSKPDFSNMWTVNSLMFKLVLKKGRETRDQIANIRWIMEKAREFQENIYFCFIDYGKAFVCITINCGKFWKRLEYQTTWPASWEICMQVRKQQLELDMEQWTGCK